MAIQEEIVVAVARQTIPGTRRHTQTIVFELANSVRERDIITYEHSRRVAVYSYRLSRQLGLSRRAGRDIALAGLVHDLGKTWIHNAVLHKETALSMDERATMSAHPRIGARFLEIYGAPEDLVEIVLHHHEAFDGSGYPDGLSGEAIPYGARIVTVADVFDVLTSDRPYKRAMDVRTARERIASGTGSHFDPVIVAAFLDLLDVTPEFCLPPRVCALPVRNVPAPAQAQHLDDFAAE
jgi:putative two-component system response regulator